MALLFLASALSGLANPDITGLRRARGLWTTLHVGLATLLPIVIGYHVLITYSLE